MIVKIIDIKMVILGKLDFGLNTSDYHHPHYQVPSAQLWLEVTDLQQFVFLYFNVHFKRLHPDHVLLSVHSYL